MRFKNLLIISFIFFSCNNIENKQATDRELDIKINTTDKDIDLSKYSKN